jgi:hypothetical protein
VYKCVFDIYNKIWRDWLLCFIIFNMFLDVWNSTVLFLNFTCMRGDTYKIKKLFHWTYILSRVARFYAITEQKLINSFWNALRIRRKFNQLHQSSCYTSSIYYTTQNNPWICRYRFNGKVFWFKTSPREIKRENMRFVSFLLYKSLKIIKFICLLLNIQTP